LSLYIVPVQAGNEQNEPQKSLGKAKVGTKQKATNAKAPANKKSKSSHSEAPIMEEMPITFLRSQN
jgi:hypothetical protein